MRTLVLALLASLRAALMPRAALALENAALRQQLASYLRTSKRPQLHAGDRVFWVMLRRLWPDWTRPLVIVKPDTVVSWHRKGFRIFWRRRSRDRRLGRPHIPGEHIAFIRRISRDHPEWGEDRITEELAAKFGVKHAARTVRRYMVSRGRPPRRDQTWRTFIRNYAKEVWACDFLTQYTALFAVVHVFVIMEVGSRRIVHANVTTSPTLAWVKQQIREATWDRSPRFIVHDNDGIYGQFGRSATVQQDDQKLAYRSHLDHWLEGVLGISGLPIPYGAPNASPYIERFMRTLRQEALDHFIFLTPDHVRRVVAEYVRYYNGARPSQAIHGIPDPYPELKVPPPPAGRLIALPVLGGVQHDYRLVA